MERWQRVTVLLDGALTLTGEQRRQFLDAACGEDADLRAEVESLLRHEDGELLDSGQSPGRAVDLRAQSDRALAEPAASPRDQRALAIGSSLAHYRVLGFLGKGGMGEVYRARDTRLERDVALKVLSAEVAWDPERLSRFEREARALAALDHPNIVQIHSVEETAGIHFITMQMVEGVRFSERVRPNGLGLDELLELAIPLTDALRAAHERGIVHRDLKPANVLLDGEKRVRVLDFGLAKMQPAFGSGTFDVTTETATHEGKVLGTLPYMSPQQADGTALDHRTDIFSLGVMLYELATGRRPFRGESAASLISSILRDTPAPVTDLNEALPPDLARIVGRCLEKDPDRRFQSAKELRNELQDLQRELSSQPSRSGPSLRWSRPWPRPRRGSGLRGAAGLAAVAGLAALVALVVPRGASDVPVAGTSRYASIAVLPLANLSGDPHQDYFVDGMTDALTANLSQLAALKVISRSSAMRFKGTDRPLTDIAAQLGVDVVLEGSVLREGDRVAVNAQLTAADTDLSLWARRYEREVTSVLALQGEVARAIAGEIAGELTDQQAERLQGDEDVDLKTYEAYLRGMHELSKRTPDAYQEGIRHLLAAVDADPADPRAYAGLATGYIRIGHGEGPSDVAFPRARAAALRALELDPDQAEAHAALADAYMYYEYDWPAARASFERAVELSPSLAEAHAHYAWWYAIEGRWDEAEREAALAVEYDPLSVTYIVWHGWLLWWMDRYDDGLVLVDRALELDPDHPAGHYVRGAILRELGRWDEAIAIHEHLCERLPPMGWALAITYALAGRSDDARRVRDSYDHAASPEATFHAAQISALLGETDDAFRLLEVAYQGRSRTIPGVGVDPHFSPLGEDPRFADLLRRLDLPRGRLTLPEKAAAEQ